MCQQFLLNSLIGSVHKPDITAITAETKTFWEFMGGGSSIGMVVIALLLLAVWALNKQNGFWTFLKKWLTPFFVVVWLLGFIVYDIGLYPGDGQTPGDVVLSLLGVAPMAVIYAFGMFILNSDISAIHEDCANSTLFMTAFALVHFMAALVSLAFVIKHFGFNILAGIKMSWGSRFKKRERLYVFWGMNDASYLLAKSIQESTARADEGLPGHKRRATDYSIVVVRTNSDKDMTSVRNGMERLFNFLSLKNKDLDWLQQLDCLTMNTFESPAELSIADNKSVLDMDIMQQQLKMHSIARMIRKKTNKEVHFFFLSDNEQDNIQSVANLKRDKILNDFVTGASEPGQRKLIFYCHARYNTVHRVIEDDLLREHIEVKVVDTSHIGVELLKQKLELQPVNYVDIAPDATVSSAFNAMVIGFGEVGVDSLRFLYEFGAFVKSGTDHHRAVQAPFHCDVVDHNMKALAGLFVASSPAIKLNLAYEQDRQHPDALITMHDIDCQSVAFYQMLKEKIKTLNYIVITMSDDETNISLAVRIAKWALRYRKDLRHFCIVVCIQHDEDGHIARIKEHYNRLFKAQEQSDDRRQEHQRIIRKDHPADGPIYLFGAEKEAYTYEHIVDDCIEKDAKTFYRLYQNGVGDWDLRHKQLLQLTDGSYKDVENKVVTYAASDTPTYAAILSLHRQENQDKANSMHKMTKQMLFDEALRLQGIKLEGSIRRQDRKVKNQENGREELVEICYVDANGQPVDARLQRIVDVLAQTEHLRWNASHEILGYEKGPEKEEVRMLHNCLVPWEDLSLDYQSYDYNVVDVSLKEIE